MGSFLSCGNHAVPCSRGRETDDMSPSFLSSRFAVRHHSNLPGAFLSTIPFQDARCETAFPGTFVPLCRIGGTCAGFRAKIGAVSGHLPDMFSEKTLPFLLSIPIRPPTMREKLSKTCQKTVGFGTHVTVDGDARLITRPAEGEDCLCRMKE